MMGRAGVARSMAPVASLLSILMPIPTLLLNGRIPWPAEPWLSRMSFGKMLGVIGRLSCRGHPDWTYFGKGLWRQVNLIPYVTCPGEYISRYQWQERPTMMWSPHHCGHRCFNVCFTCSVMSCQKIPINVLFDTGCLQINVVGEREANFIRQDDGKLRQANVVLTSGVGGVSYSAQASISMTVSLPIPDTPV